MRLGISPFGDIPPTESTSCEGFRYALQMFHQQKIIKVKISTNLNLANKNHQHLTLPEVFFWSFPPVYSWFPKSILKKKKVPQLNARPQTVPPPRRCSGDTTPFGGWVFGAKKTSHPKKKNKTAKLTIPDNSLLWFLDSLLMLPCLRIILDESFHSAKHAKGRGMSRCLSKDEAQGIPPAFFDLSLRGPKQRLSQLLFVEFSICVIVGWRYAVK